MKINDGIEAVDNKIYSILMIGQSNMAGRGDFGEVEKINNPNCYMLRMGRWQAMREPVNADRYVLLEDGDFHSGVSPAASLADDMAKDTGKKIGLIPCADGGTSLNQWMPGEILFDHAVMQASLAMRTSELVAIVWHQGEADARRTELIDTYKERFITMISAMREQLGVDVPVVLGEIAHKINPKYEVTEENSKRINEVFLEITKELPRSAVASSAGLSMKRDGIHFDSAGAREFGHRYYAKLKELL
jgi:hypothetical protein